MVLGTGEPACRADNDAGLPRLQIYGGIVAMITIDDILGGQESNFPSWPERIAKAFTRVQETNAMVNTVGQISERVGLSQEDTLRLMVVVLARLSAAQADRLVQEMIRAPRVYWRPFTMGVAEDV